MRKKEIKELTKSDVLRIDPRYNLTTRDILEIGENADGWYEMIGLAFSYGYLQGSKAAKKAVKT